jgi:hypothetical protein
MSPYVAFMACFVVEVGRATCRYFWLYVALKREGGNGVTEMFPPIVMEMRTGSTNKQISQMRQSLYILNSIEEGEK